MMCSAEQQDSIGLMLEEASEVVYEGQRRCVAWGEWSLRQVAELHCAVRESHKESSEPVPWWKQHFFWKLEEPDFGSSSAVNCLAILSASSPALGSSFLIQ